MTEEQERFEVEGILDYRDTPEELWLVKWKNYSDSSNTWEPKDDLHELLMWQQFEAKRRHNPPTKSNPRIQEWLKLNQRIDDADDETLLRDYLKHAAQSFGLKQTLHMLANGASEQQCSSMRDAFTNIKHQHEQQSQLQNVRSSGHCPLEKLSQLELKQSSKQLLFQDLSQHALNHIGSRRHTQIQSDISAHGVNWPQVDDEHVYHDVVSQQVGFDSVESLGTAAAVFYHALQPRNTRSPFD